MELINPIHIRETSGGAGFPFLHLPIEIRLCVYYWLYRMSPVRETVLTPWCPTPAKPHYVVRRLYADQGVEETPDAREPSPNQLLSPYRPLAGVPTALLRSNRQIYHEVRDLPMRRNEFMFLYWFASGLWPARAFVKGLQAWQQDAMSYVRLELLARDLSGTHDEQWRELCELWSVGLRGLRLKIIGNSESYTPWATDSLKPCQSAPVMEVVDTHGKANNWIEAGIRKLRRLQTLEVELAIPGWGIEEKIEWCRRLESALNDKTNERDKDRHVWVVCVEKAA
ncbi:hypothetical protein BX600DRAFT_430211 [Xylariales sp. PMI_506]|nr:hypothetical protein BX600DRAFT_430211 [Xylariales sp. PMI_506]